MKTIKIIALTISLMSGIHATLVEKPMIYQQGGATLEGFSVHDDAVTGKRPGVLVIHQWTGLTDYEKQRCRMLAELGYNVLAADIYGQGIRPQPPAAGTEAGKYKGDRKLYRARMLGALDLLKADNLTDTGKIAAIGYCFGGTGVLEMARAGTDIAGVVSFHGGLDPAPEMAAEVGKIPARVLVLHGADDPFVPAEQIAAFQKEMTVAKADWQMVYYSNAVHAFTQKLAGNDNSKGAAYNETADRRSWETMKSFFAEIFR